MLLKMLSHAAQAVVTLVSPYLRPFPRFSIRKRTTRAGQVLKTSTTCWEVKQLL